MDALINYLEKYSSQVLFIQIGFIVIISAVFIWLWFYNRKKYNHLKHQIPASVVKSYLDSIIQNSTALKSSLFRGGGLDVDPNSIPSVMPVSDLPAGAPAGVDAAEVSSLRAQIAQLQSQLSEKQLVISDLEDAKTTLEGEVGAKQERIEELEALLAQAQENTGSAGDGELEAKLASVTRERDQLKDTLTEYEVIEDDLANLKRLKQENEQLKKSLGQSGAAPISEAPAPEPEPIAESAPFISKFAAHPHWMLRLASLKVLLALGQKQYKDLYVRALKDKALIVRHQALENINRFELKNLAPYVWGMLYDKSRYLVF